MYGNSKAASQFTKVKDSLEKLESKNHGRPTLLMEVFEQKDIDYIKCLRLAGGVINTAIALNIDRGVVIDKDKFLLCENGGYIDLTRDWARSLLRCLNFTKHKSTKGVKTVASDLEKIKSEYLQRIDTAVTENHIPSNLIINWDQTGLNMVPASKWTMTEKGSKQVRVLGSDDKWQITALPPATLSGEFLPLQITGASFCS